MFLSVEGVGVRAWFSVGLAVSSICRKKFLHFNGETGQIVSGIILLTHREFFFPLSAPTH